MKAIMPLLALAALLGGCQVDRQPNVEFLPWLNHMMFSSAAESQAASPVRPDGKPVFADGKAMQLPPAGTIPRGHRPLHYGTTNEERDRAGAELKNPFEPTQEVLERGKDRYMVFCAPCHGIEGAGDGPVSKRGMPGFPVNNPTGGAGTLADGHVFHIITYGRGTMPSYATQVGEDDRWKIIHFLRRLQGKL